MNDCEADGDVSTYSMPHFLLKFGNESGNSSNVVDSAFTKTTSKDHKETEFMDVPNFTDRFLTLQKTNLKTLPYTAHELATNGYLSNSNRTGLVCFLCKFNIRIEMLEHSPQLLIERHQQKSPKCENVLNNTLKPASAVVSDSPRTVRAASTQALPNQYQQQAIPSTKTRSTSELVSSRSHNELPVPVHVKSLNGRLSNESIRVRTGDQNSSSQRNSIPANNNTVKTQHPKGHVPFVAKPIAVAREYESYENRLASYTDWPSSSPMDPEELARAGFYYTHYRDKTKCPFCNGSVYNWESTDTAFGEHKRHYPQCDYLKYLTFQILTTPVPSVSITPDSEPRDAESYSVQAVVDIGYPAQVVQPVLAALHKQNKPVTSSTILDAIFAIEEKEGRSLYDLSSGDSLQSSIGDVQGAIGGLNLNEENMESQAASSISPPDVGDDLYEAHDSGTFNSVGSDAGDNNATPRLPSFDANPNRKSTRQSASKSSSPKSSPKKNSIPITPEIEKVQKEYKRLQKSNICNKCLKRPVNTLFLPCRHLVTCETCAEAIDNCLHCKEEIIGTVKVFLP